MRCLSTTTLRGGLPGIGSNGSMTCKRVKFKWVAYLGVNVSDTFSLFGVMAEVHVCVSEVVFADDNTLTLWLNKGLLDQSLRWSVDA